MIKDERGGGQGASLEREVIVAVVVLYLLISGAVLLVHLVAGQMSVASTEVQRSEPAAGERRR